MRLTSGAQDKAKRARDNKGLQRSRSMRNSEGAAGEQGRSGSLRRSLSRKQSMSLQGDELADSDQDEEDRALDGVVHQGKVRKRGRNRKAYQERYFVLTDDAVLKYYISLEDFLNNEPWQGSMVCFGGSVEEETFHAATGSDASSYKFSLIDAFGRRLDCEVDSASESVDWVKALRRKVYTEEGEEAARLEVLCEGIVWKRGQFNPFELRLNPLFQKRYFVLTGDGWLKNYKTEADFKRGCLSVGALLCQDISLEEDVGRSISGMLSVGRPPMLSARQGQRQRDRGSCRHRVRGTIRTFVTVGGDREGVVCANVCVHACVRACPTSTDTA